jgi:hypothetical protein
VETVCQRANDSFLVRGHQEREHSRIAFCECGAQLAGESRGQLFDAAQAHLAHHHPELLGALGLEMVQQMAEERPGAVNA